MRPRPPAARGQQVIVSAESRSAILLVEENDELRESRLKLLSLLDSSVQVADIGAALCECIQGDSFRLVVISVRSTAETERLAFTARRRWPKAKILLLGSTANDLQDFLFDNIVDPRCNPVGFVEISRRLLNEFPPDPETPGEPPTPTAGTL